MSRTALTILGILAPLAIVAGCAPTEPPAPQAAPRAAAAPVASAPDPAGIMVALLPCDDGGSGGVLIDNICL